MYEQQINYKQNICTNSVSEWIVENDIVHFFFYKPLSRVESDNSYVHLIKDDIIINNQSNYSEAIKGDLFCFHTAVSC